MRKICNYHANIAHNRNRLHNTFFIYIQQGFNFNHTMFKIQIHTYTRRHANTLSEKQFKQVELRVIGAALKCAPIMEWEFILASGRSSF